MRLFGYLLCSFALWAGIASSEIVMTVDVDGTELPRRLLHSRMEIPAEPGAMALWFPKWIPGIHYYGGPVQNMAGLEVETASGEPIPWHRDEIEYWRFWVDVPEHVDRIIVSMDYITNQPTVQSTGIDSYGYANLGVVNFNTCLLYPDGFSNEEINVRLRFKAPPAWQWATSLKQGGGEAPWTAFEQTTLEEIIDSPLLCGAFFKTVVLEPANGPKAYLHMAGAVPSAVESGDDVKEEMTRLMAETYAMHGGAPFNEYHFLLALSEDIPGIGLEHLRSSLNAEGERAIVDAKLRSERIAYLLPHELNHAWCGKWRRPAGMAVTNYHDPMRTNQLWIYEGLDQYLGEVLMVRAGLVDPGEYHQRFAMKLLGMQSQQGRAWRPLEDTAVFAGPLRGASPSWNTWRRGQDYYNEGLLIWLEVDGYLRAKSSGRKSLDDFCQVFFAPGNGEAVMKPFTLDEACAVLNDLVPRDWQAFFSEKVEQAQEEISTDFVELLGYRIEYAEKPSDYRLKSDKDRKRITLLESIGMSLRDSGEVADVIRGSVADKAGLGPGMTIAAVNSWRFTADRFRDAVSEASSSGNISLLILDGDRYGTLELAYTGGPRYTTLVREKGRADIFGAILKPQAKRE